VKNPGLDSTTDKSNHAGLPASASELVDHGRCPLFSPHNAVVFELTVQTSSQPMKTLLLMITCLLALVSPALAAEKPAKERKGRLQHVVAFKFKEDVTQTQIQGVEKAFAELPKKIREIQHFEWGTNVSPEKHDKGFTHGFILTFKTAADRDAYLVHPDHKAFGNLVGPFLADVFVIDFWAE
jgi:hypothetical protein